MRIKLFQIGLQKTQSPKILKPRLPKVIEGNLKSPVRTRWPVKVELDDGRVVSTALVRRSGPGWIITDEADYAISYANAVPLVPTAFSASLDNVFTNEPDLISRSLDLLGDAEELRDTPATRELGYTEYVSQELGYALNEFADLTAEAQIAVADAQRVLVAALSAQAADLFHQLHPINYRSRFIALPTSHAVRGVKEARNEVSALAVYVGGRIIHCLPAELPINEDEHGAHIVAMYSLVEKLSRAAKAKRLSNPRALREHGERENQFEHAEAAV